MKKTSSKLKEKQKLTKPHTLDEIHDAAKKRLSLITKEFNDGFEFIKDYGKSVTFFGSSRIREDSHYYKQTQSLANRIAKTLGYAVISGGGPGIMEAANKGAFEGGAPSLGITIDLPHEQPKNSYITDQINFYYFFSRKVIMSFSAEAYIFAPGGFGTLDELFEILTLIQTNKIEKVPVILIGSDFWNKVDTLLREEILGKEMIDESDLSLYKITDNEDEILEIIRKVPVRNGVPYHSDAMN